MAILENNLKSLLGSPVSGQVDIVRTSSNDHATRDFFLGGGPTLAPSSTEM